MECTETAFPGNKEYFIEFNRKSVQLRIPLSGGLDITHRCNLRCIHCYLGDNANRTLSKEMDTKHVVSILDQITDRKSTRLNSSHT